MPGGSKLSPEAIAQKVAQQTGVVGINTTSPSDADAWKMLAAGAAHAKAVEAFSTEDKDGEGDNTASRPVAPTASCPPT